MDFMHNDVTNTCNGTYGEIVLINHISAREGNIKLYATGIVAIQYNKPFVSHFEITLICNGFVTIYLLAPVSILLHE